MSAAKKEEVSCGKCGSTQLHVDGKKFDVANALTGLLWAGPVGLLFGKLTDKSLVVTCIQCGNQWKVKPQK